MRGLTSPLWPIRYKPLESVHWVGHVRRCTGHRRQGRFGIGPVPPSVDTLTAALHSFHIDHDHSCCPGSTSCGMCIRSPLCMACNILIGHMEKAGPGVVALAAQYLLRSKAEVLEDLPAS